MSRGSKISRRGTRERSEREGEEEECKKKMIRKKKEDGYI